MYLTGPRARQMTIRWGYASCLECWFGSARINPVRRQLNMPCSSRVSPLQLSPS